MMQLTTKCFSFIMHSLTQKKNVENFAHTLKEWIGNNLSPIVGALFQANQLHIEYEGGVGRNDAHFV